MTDKTIPSDAPGNWRAARPMELDPYYCHWVSKLTSDDLHAKSDIATVLALLHRELDELKDDCLRLHREKCDLLFAQTPRPEAAESEWLDKACDALRRFYDDTATLWAKEGERAQAAWFRNQTILAPKALRDAFAVSPLAKHEARPK